MLPDASNLIGGGLLLAGAELAAHALEGEANSLGFRLSIAAFQPAHAAVSNYGQATETGAYAPGGSAYPPRGGN